MNPMEAETVAHLPRGVQWQYEPKWDGFRCLFGTEDKDDAATVARLGFDAMMKGEGDVVTGLKNKIQSAIANVTQAERLAKQHRKMAEPGTAKS